MYTKINHFPAISCADFHVVKAVVIVISVHFNYRATFFIVSHVLSTIKCVTKMEVKPGFQDKEKVSLFYE